MSRWLGLLLAALLLWPAAAGAQTRLPRIALVSIHLAEFPNLARAAATREAGRATVDLYGLGGGLLPSVEGVDLAAYDLVLLDGASGPRLINFKPQLDRAKAATKLLTVDGDAWIQGNVDPAVHPDVLDYWKNGTEENFARLYTYLRVRLLGGRGTVEPPVVYPSLAFHHPDATSAFATRADYEAWAASRLSDAAVRPRIGIVFYRSLALAGNMGVVDALVREVERQGGLPLAVWRQTGTDPLPATIGSGLDALVLCGAQINYADHAAGIAAAQAIGVPVLNCYTAYNQTPEDWAKSPGGFAPAQTGELAMGETEGISEPMTVGGRVIAADGSAVNTPIPAQVEWRVSRAMAWARLHRLANHDKRLVVTFFSEEGGKANVGSDPDSYLDAQASLVALLNRLRAEGYDVGDAPLPDRDELARRMAEDGSNVGVWDPEALERRIAEGQVALVPETAYRRWWDEAPPAGRRQVEAIWGPPPGELMVHKDQEGRRSIVIPLLRFGKVALIPHPTWGYLQNDKALAFKGAMPPHHQYIAAYAWMRKVWKADAYLPLFSQLSLMPGKQEGPARDDWVGWLIGDLPHISPTPLQANGAVGGKRRTQALTIGFMPTLKRMSLSPDLAALKSGLGAEAETRALAVRLELGRALGLDVASAAWNELQPAIGAYLAEAERAVSPSGGHVLGVAPDAPAAAEMVRAMLAGDSATPPPSSDLLVRVLAGDAVEGVDPAIAERARNYAARIGAAGREMDGVIAALAGRYIEPGPNGDAVRTPDAIPGGRNPYTLDPRVMPTRAAWEAGSKLADDMVANYRAKHGRYPRKTAFVLWSSESVQHQGVMEAEILRLMGARPVWNPRGQVVDVVLDPASSLGRPRIDVLVTTSGTYRDHFGEKIALLAKAARLAAEADEPDNAVRAAALAAEQTFVRAGAKAEEARRRAVRRVFSTAPGAYSPSTQWALKAGPEWDDARIAGLYNDRLGHAYGDGDEGAADPEAFLANLDTVDASVFSRSSNAYGLLETPMPAAYFGGLSMAVRARTGATVETYVADLTSPDSPRIEGLARTFQRELATRYFNPDWIKAMQAGGYNGARYMAEFADNMLLWDVVTPELVTDGDWATAKSVLVDDRFGLGLKAYFEKANPYAKQQMIGAMLEAVRRGRWNADAATVSDLRGELQRLNAVHGASCDRTNCPHASKPAAAPGTAAASGRVPAKAPAKTASAARSALVSKPVITGFEMTEAARSLKSAATPVLRADLVWLMLLLGGVMVLIGASRRPQW